MTTDFGLSEASGVYTLTDPVTDPQTRVRNRFRVQFLSQKSGTRGSFFVSEMLKGRIKTNADIVSLFALTASNIITIMRALSLDLYPTRASLNSFAYNSGGSIHLDYTVYTAEGEIRDNIVVTEEIST